MNDSQLLSELQTLLESHKALSDYEERRKWMAKAAALVEQVNGPDAEEIRRRAQVLSIPLSTYTKGPAWGQALQIVENVVAKLELGENSARATPSETKRMSKDLRGKILLLLEEHARARSPYFKEDKEIAERLDRPVHEVQRQLDILESQGLITAANSSEGNSARISPQGSLEVERLEVEESVGLRHQTPLPVGEPDPRRVFVVHGRNQAARSAVSAFLRSIDLQPIEWTEAVRLTGDAAPFVGQVVEAGFSAAQAVVVILTGDDLAQLRQELLQDDDPIYEREPTPQARPNVLFEAGYAFAKHPSRTIILEFGRLRPFSDVQGRHVVRMNGTGEKRQELADRLASAGCAVSLRGTDWHSAGDFSGLV